MDNLIDVRNLSFSFGKGELENHVLKDVSLQIKAGEIVIMTGPSGSGKTTLLTLIGALRRAQQGSVKLFGHELVKARESTLNKIRLNIGYIFQSHNLLEGLTASQNVMMSLELRKGLSAHQRKNMAAQMLTNVGLEERLHYKPNKLSGGQKQRVSIARALVAQPRLILADEPTASLDKASGLEAVNILKDLARKKNTTILLVTHDYRILDIADRVIHLEDGQIVEKTH
jgi:putative ABC transport system ATP-binding protein